MVIQYIQNNVEMQINRTKKLFQSHENIKLTTIFKPSSMLRYRPLFNVEALTLYQCWNMVARRRDQYSTIFQRWYTVVWLLG